MLRAFPLKCVAAERGSESGAVSFKELLESWREHAAVPRTAETYAVRLPLEDAARLAALADLFPGRSPNS